MKKRVLAIMLVCFMLVSLLPMGVFAADEESTCPGHGNKHYLEQMKEGTYEFVENHTSDKCGEFNYKLWKCLECGDYFASEVTSNGLTHKWDKVEEKAPTCTEEGYVKYECSVCAATYTDTVAATGHTKGEGVATGDCTTGVTVTYTCTVCGEVVETVTGQTGHNLPKVPVISEDEQWAYFACQNEGCDFVKNVPIYCHVYTDDFQYNIVTIPGKPATCTEMGYTESVVCSKCGEVFVESKPIDLKPHNKDGKVFQVSDQPIMVGGEYGTRYEFSFAEDTEITFYTKNENTWVTVQYEGDDGWWYQTDPYSIVYMDENDDGKEDGVTIQFQANVKYRLTNWDVAAAVYQGSYVDYVVNTGDCEHMPSITWNCSACGQDWSETYCATCGKASCDHEDLEKYGHVLECFEDIKPTCTSYGFYVIGCVVCGKVNENQQLDKLPHTYKKVVTAPTCTEGGFTTYTCACGDTYVADETAPLGHNLDTVVVPGTCAEKAYSYQYCKNNCDTYTPDGLVYTEDYSECRENVKGLNVVPGSLVIGTTDPTVHNDRTYTYLNEPTCTEDGNAIYLCNDCHRYFGEIRPATDHTKETVTYTATCGTAGYSYDYCTVCGWTSEPYGFVDPQMPTEDGLNENGQAFTLTEAEAEHDLNWNTVVVIRDETHANMCEVVGLFEITCNDCMVSILVETPGTGSHTHGTLPAYDANWVAPYTEAQAATASKLNGTYTNWYGDVSFNFVPNETLTAGIVDVNICDVQYDENWNPIETYYTATMEYAVNEDGMVELTPVDGEVPSGLTVQTVTFGLYVMYDGSWGIMLNDYYGEELTLRTEQEHAGYPADCENAGQEESYYCTRCGEFQEGAVIPAKGHNAPEATCTTAGVCKVCKKVVTNATGHDWKDTGVVEATCTTAGYTSQKCDNCGATQKINNVPALGHDVRPIYMQKHVEYFDSIENYLYQFGFVQWECVRCGDGHGDLSNGYGYILDYEGVDCMHSFIRTEDTAFNDVPSADCKTPNKIAYECELCGHLEYVDGTEYAPHNNGTDDLFAECTNSDVENRTCATCGTVVPKVEHFTVGVTEVEYPATCKNDAYIMRMCSCGLEEVVKVEGTMNENLHDYSAWEIIYTDDVNNIPDYKVRVCSLCMDVDTEELNGLIYTAKIENALVPGAAITDGSTVVVTVSIMGSEDYVWGFKLDIPYSDNMTFVNAEFVNADFTEVTKANATFSEELGKYVAVAAQASKDVEISNPQAVVKLYFTVNAPEAADLTIGFANIDTLNLGGDVVDADAVSATVKTIVLMDLNGDGKVNMKDINMAYNMYLDDGYNAAADLNKDRKVNMKDIEAMYDYYVDILSYDDIVALEPDSI